MRKYKALAFDLDDTLLDTSSLLVPLASRNACQKMLDEGLQCDLDTCIQMRGELANQLSHPEIFAQIAKQFGCRNEALAIDKAIQEFYSPAIPESLPLIVDAEKNLQSLQVHYKLFLVTMGLHETQSKKIKALGIKKYFTEIFIIDGLQGHRKEEAFKKILESQKIQPHELLSIGNRLSSEIRDAKKCGADTCYFEYGEHVGEEPHLPEDSPDFVITKHGDLVSACAL